MKFRVFWDIAPCNHVEVDGRFRGAYCLHHQGDSTDISAAENLSYFKIYKCRPNLHFAAKVT
jgi:hypothetical protein